VNKVAQTLFQLYCEDRLAPFYIIRPPVAGVTSQFNELLKKVYIDFSGLVLARHKYADTAHTLEIGHSDIVYIEKEDKLKDYKQDDPAIQQFFSSQKHGPLSLEKKFIWIDQAHHISDRFLNKWLKTLEEPTASLTTFFLVPDHGPLLQTIESRAITLKIEEDHLSRRPVEPYSNFTEFLEKFHDDTDLHTVLLPYLENHQQVHRAIEALKSKPELHKSMLLAFQEFWSHCDATPLELQRVLEEIQWHNKSKTFNNMATERLYGLFSCLNQRI
jgi:hypothetical protein